MSNTTVVILAGGQGRRFTPRNPGDKCLRRIADKTILQWIIDRLTPQTQTILLNANGDRKRFHEFNLTTIADNFAGISEQSAGPLSGVLATMVWLKQRQPQADMLFSVPADCPFLPMNLLSQLQATPATHIAYATCGEQQHPLCAKWPLALLEKLQHHLTTGKNYKVRDWLAENQSVEVDFHQDDYDPFLNINTIGDLSAAEKVAIRFFSETRP